MNCPECGSTNVTAQTFQENRGSKTVTKTKFRGRERGHGCIWWLLIGWWWWIIDMLLWILLFFPRLCIRLIRKKKYTGKATSVSKTVDDVVYTTVCVCNDCGYRWNI